jgi:hypothetical protein
MWIGIPGGTQTALIISGRGWRQGILISPPYALDPEWREDIPLRSIEIAERYDGCDLLLYPKPTDPGGEWQVWLGICGGYDRYETLPDYIDDTIEEFEQRRS